MIETTDIGMPKRRGRPPKISIAEYTNEHQAIKERWAASEQMAQQIAHWATRLEYANSLKAGLMDSESRHEDIAKQRTAIIESVIAEMRSA